MGKLADLVVLNKNPIESGIEDLQVDYTIIDGKIIYTRK